MATVNIDLDKEMIVSKKHVKRLYTQIAELEKIISTLRYYKRIK